MHIKKLLIALTAFLLVFSFSAWSQSREISGRVTDAGGSPLVGVTVVAKETSTGTVTNANGTFQFNVPAGADTLVVSYVGYTTKEVPISSNGNMQISLQASSASLNELVVIGYGMQRKKDLTGAIATVNAKDFQKGAITSPSQLIAGKISGVSITSDGGAPGAGSTIRIRGIASLNGNKDPLIVIDGVPLAANKDIFGSPTIAGVANPLSLINPNDIASITVLKDASAAAIYGSRASAGVILITTKSGHGGKPKFNFSTSLSFSKIPKKVDVLSPKQFRTFVKENGDSSYQALLGNANTDWQDKIYHTAITTISNLSISGEIKNMPYRVSVGYTDQQGILKTSKLQRTTASVRLSPILLNGHLKIDLNANGSLSKTRFANQDAIIAAVQFDPTKPVLDSGSEYGGYWEWQTNGILAPLAVRNPVALLMQKHDNGTANRLFGNIKFDYSLPMLPELHAILNLGLDVSKGEGTVHVPGNAAQSWATTTNHGFNSQYLQKRTNKVGEFSLNYIKDITSIKSNINLTAGYGYYNDLTTNYNYPNLDSKGDTIPGSAPVFPFDKPENTLISYYGRLIYTYNGKYILTASLRTDGSSRFAPDVRWGVFPAVAFAWRINQEDFLKAFEVVSNLKLRLSYGVTGNQEGIGNYSYLPVYNLSSNASQYQLGDKFYYMATPSPYVSDFTWEQTASTNIGVDYGFLNNRINGSINFYFKKTKNLLDYITIPVGSNFTNKITTNIGNMTSKGIEFSINAIPIQNKNLSWDIGFNIAYNKINITKLRSFKDTTFLGDEVGAITGATGQNIQIQTEDHTPYSFFVYQQVYDENGKPIEGVYVDQDNDGIINDDDKYRYKSPFAPVILGFSTQLNYKKWSLSTTLRAKIGNYIYNNVSSNMGVERSIINPINILMNSSTDIYNTGFYNNQYHSDYYIQNASFLKMDNIGIGYNVLSNNKWNLALSLHCQNVFTITKYEGLDPEVYGGIDYNLYPRPRTYTIGVNVGF